MTNNSFILAFIGGRSAKKQKLGKEGFFILFNADSDANLPMCMSKLNHTEHIFDCRIYSKQKYFQETFCKRLNHFKVHIFFWGGGGSQPDLL